MNEFSTRKEPRKNFVYSWFFLAVLLIILGLFAKSAYASFSKKKNAEQERVKYHEKKQELESKKKALEDKINALKTDRGVEEELRLRYNIKKSGETLIRIIEE